MGRFQRAPFLPSSALTILAVACQSAAAPPKPADPSKPAETKPAAPVATAAPVAAVPARPAEAPKPAEADKPAAAPASAPAGTPRAGGTLRVALSGDLLTLDPRMSSSSFDRRRYQRMFDIADDTPMVFIQHRPGAKVMLPTEQGFSHVADGMMPFGRVTSKE